MVFVDWTDKLSVGVGSIDQQHKRLVGLINQLHTAMSAGQGQAMLIGVYNELVDYTRTHFAHEEKLLRTHSYHDLPGHHAVHAKLTKDVLGLQNKLADKKAVLSVEVLDFLRAWLTDHIMNTDQRYASLLQSARAN